MTPDPALGDGHTAWVGRSNWAGRVFGSVRPVSEVAALLGRVWRAEAEATARVTRAMAQFAGTDAVASRPLGDGVLVALGPGRYVNRAIGVGPDLDDADLDAVEEFFASRGLPPSVQLSSWVSEQTLARMSSRGYRPQWFRSVFARALPIPDPPTRANDIDERDRIGIVAVGDEELDVWLDVLAEGNEVATAEGRVISDEFGRGAHRAVGSADFLAIIDGRAVGCGSLQVVSDVALLGGAATQPAHRGRGVQSALLRHRVRRATELGCNVVAATAVSAGASARNLLRHGLRLVDTQLVMTAEPDDGLAT
jgi:GNAT superfamily N-acetyltransferase